MSPSTILEEWHKEEEKAKELFQRYKDMASEKGGEMIQLILLSMAAVQNGWQHVQDEDPNFRSLFIEWPDSFPF